MSGTEASTLIWLEFPRGVLVEELKRINRVLGRRSAGQAVLGFVHGHLVMRMASAECVIPAVGHWPGEAVLTAAWLRSLAKVPPAQDPVRFELQGNKLRMGSSAVSCRWQAAGTSEVEVPAGHALLTLLRLSLAHDDAELAQAGLTRPVAEARAELEKRIKAAARQLAPLGVGESDVRLLVTGKFSL